MIKNLLLPSPDGPCLSRDLCVVMSVLRRLCLFNFGGLGSQQNFVRKSTKFSPEFVFALLLNSNVEYCVQSLSCFHCYLVNWVYLRIYGSIHQGHGHLWSGKSRGKPCAFMSLLALLTVPMHGWNSKHIYIYIFVVACESLYKLCRTQQRLYFCA